ncbi:hypothetical protein BKA56DRAFT_614314 [Ilyonectria sp. MPI-CAGE-AT-0026]|nr:hypothetical protein BKA56DRAFT_614314 [Ilyonectria sp. MPI-CAGE-AT-0026]
MASRMRSTSDGNLAPRAKKARIGDPLSFKMIRVFCQGDIDSLYPLIVAYIERPSLADSVVEFAIDTEGWPSYNFGAGDTCAEVSSRPVNDDAHAAIEAYVRDMGLGDEALGVMLPALEWKKRQLRDGVEESRAESNAHVRDFATTASTILLSLCKNITTLYLGNLGSWESPLQLYLLLAGMYRIPRPGLRKVKKVEIIAGATDYTDERQYALLDYQTFFNYICRLPALESVVFDGAGDFEGSTQTLPRRMSNMKEISITHADIPSSALAKILRIPKHLEKLTLSFGGLMFIDGGSAMVCPRTIGEHLSRHRKTLKVLDLDIDYSLGGQHEIIEDSDSDQEEASTSQRDPLSSLVRRLERQRLPQSPPDLPKKRKYGYGLTVGSFDDYQAMTHLSIGVKALLGPTEGSRLKEQPPFRLIDALPPTLEYLCLYGYEKGENSDVDEHVDEFMEQKEERLPLLEEVEGVDERIEDSALLYNQDDEDSLWERPERDFDWIKA